LKNPPLYKTSQVFTLGGRGVNSKFCHQEVLDTAFCVEQTSKANVGDFFKGLMEPQKHDD
jgi:hypothetical protein